MNDPLADAMAPFEAAPARDGAAGHAAPQHSFTAELGRRIKRLRVDRGLTLKDLEARGGISATHVSEIERGKASPTVGALGRIAIALGVKPAQLVSSPELPDTHLVRAADREALAFKRGTLSVAPLAGPVHGSRLAVHRFSIAPGAAPALEHRHEGEEWLTVLAGSVEVRFEHETFALEPGDSLHFRAHRTHAYVNAGRVNALLVSASQPRITL